MCRTDFLCRSDERGQRPELTTLASFDGTDGEFALGPLVQATDGNFYGTTETGGANGAGTIYAMTPGGQLTALYTFCSQPNCADGLAPYAGLVQATNGNFYGTTAFGGGNANCYGNTCGTIFEMTPQGELTSLYAFCPQKPCRDGAYPYGGLTQAVSGNLYGTASAGGTHMSGTVFEITLGGGFTTLASFCPQPGCAGGSVPAATLLQATNRSFYGTTRKNGSYDGGVFRVTPAGYLTTLHNFCGQPDCADGKLPSAGLVQARNGNLYGATEAGGNCQQVSGGCGTIYEITLSGQLTTIYNFCSQPNCADGWEPDGNLVEATDGNLYGMTILGGNPACLSGAGCGTVFEITPSGQLTTVYSFCSQPNCADGWDPTSLMQDTDGNLYGTTLYGGANDCESGLGCGTVFRLSVGLGAFVKTLPAAGKVGAEVGILGNSLTGATSVTFNGVPAQFTVKSPTLIVTHLPSGATTGTVQVTLPAGTLSSNVPFYVIP